MQKLTLLTSLISLVLISPSFTWADANSTFHMQATTVTQEHAGFEAPYAGQNSLNSGGETDTSLTWTLFMGRKLWHGGEFYINPELAGGNGLSKTLGIAGFPNGEIYRVDDPEPKWNLARLFVKQVFGFGGAQEKLPDDINQIESTVDVHRLTFIAGKFALNDYLDNNSYAHDPRTQFLNWALMDYGAWDYAADTRGYSWGYLLDYNEAKWAIRFASVMVPLEANQLAMDTRFPTARGDNLEFEYRYHVSARPGTLRLLAFENHANMGNYRTTIETPSYGMDVTKSRSMSDKYGAGLSLEQKLADNVGGFLRASWDDGHTETWAFAEIDASLSLGVSMDGRMWDRPDDSSGVAYIINELSGDHRDYLADGGYGFMLGDGKLDYSPERIAEAFYSFNVVTGLHFSGDYQFVTNPAYNADRGPVSIFAMRLHYEM